MALSTQEALSNCYNISTPSGEGGGDPFEAAWNRMAYDAAYAHVHSGMKALQEHDEVLHSLLLVLFTSVFSIKDVNIITDYMYQVWSLETEDLNLKPATKEKARKFLQVCLQCDVHRQTGIKPTIESICRLIGINRADWSKKGRPAQWKVWYNSQLEMLETLQVEASMFMQPYIDKTEAALRRRYH